MLRHNNIFTFNKEPRSINDFDEPVAMFQEQEVALGNFLKFLWFPLEYRYNINEFLDEKALSCIKFCTDELLLRLYKQSICLIAHLKNIPIQSFPEDNKIIQAKFQTNNTYDKDFLFSDQKNSFYKFFTYNPNDEMKKSINIPYLNFLIQSLKERGLSEQALIHPEDINNIFSLSPKNIIYTPDGQNILFFSNIPTNGNNFECLDKYVDSVSQFIAQKNYNGLSNMRYFINDFAIMFRALNKNKDEYFKEITKKYLKICSDFTDAHTGLLAPKHFRFQKDLVNFKKQKPSFAQSIFEDNIEILEVDFQTFDTKTVLIDISLVQKYQRDKYQKSIEPDYIQRTLQKQFEELNFGVSSIPGNNLYLTFFNQKKLSKIIFDKLIDDFIILMLDEKINPKKSFLKEFNIMTSQAEMENDILPINQESNPHKTTKINKF